MPKKLFLTLSLLTLFYKSISQIYCLPEVVVWDTMAVQKKGDTLTYRVDKLLAKSDKSLEDLLIRIPGIAIMQDGSIMYNDKRINHFYIEGLDLLSGKYALATRHVNPADLCEIEILEYHQPIKVLKDYLPSENAAINIKLKKEKLAHPIGYAQGEIGVKDNSLEHNEELYLMNLSKQRQWLFLLGENDHWYVDKGQLSVDVSDAVESKETLITPFEKALFGIPDIPAKRYLDRKSRVSQINQLKKTKNNYELRLIASVANLNDEFQQNRLGEYLSSSGIQYMNVHAQTRLKSRECGVQFQIEKNEDNHYLKHESRLSLIDDKDDYQIRNASEIANNNVLQALEADRLSYVGTTKLLKRRGANSVFQIDSKMSFGNNPTKLLFSTEEQEMNQFFKSSLFAFDVSTTTYFKVFNINNVGVVTNMKVDVASLRSYMFESNHTRGSENLCHYNRLEMSLVPFTQYQKDRLKVRFEIPFEMNITNAKNRSVDLKLHKKPVLLGLRALASYKLSPLITLSSEILQKKEKGSATDIATNPILASFSEVKILGCGEFSDTEKLAGNCQFLYRNVLSGLSFSVVVSARNSKVSQMNSSSFQRGIYTISNVVKSNKQKQKQLRSDIFKNFFDLEWTVRLLTIVSNQSGDYLHNNNLYDLSSSNISASLWSEKFFFNRTISLRNSCSYIRRTNEYLNDNFRSEQESVSISMINRLFWTIYKGWDISIGHDSQWTSQNNYHPNHYADASIRWKGHHHEISINANNIMNDDVWLVSSYSNLNHYQYEYVLRPLEFIATYRYNF